MSARAKRVVFCWSGGGLSGLDIHCGIWQALNDLSVHSTANAGTSAGAVMAALNSMPEPYGPAQAESLLRSLSDDDVRCERFAWKVRIPWIDSILKPGPIRKVLERELPRFFHDLGKPCTVMTTNDATGELIPFKRGPLVPAVLASLSISGVWPPVRMIQPGVTCSDGGSCCFVPLPHDRREWDEVWLLIARQPVNYPQTNIISRLMHNIDLMIEAQVNDTIRRGLEIWGPRLHVIRPSIKQDQSSLHFNHELIDDARLAAYPIIRKELGR